MARQLLQIRPKGVPDAPSYSPQRDLANLYPHAMREAVLGLDKANWQEYFAGWLAATNTTEDMLGEGIRRFTEAQHLFVGDPEITSPVEAFQKVGFFELPHPVRIMLYERLGEVMAAGFFVALRDVTPQGGLPPNEGDIAAYVAAGRAMSDRLTGSRQYGDLEQLNLELVLRLEAAIVEREDMRRVLQKCRAEKQALQTRLETKPRRQTLWQTLRDWWGSRPRPAIRTTSMRSDSLET